MSDGIEDFVSAEKELTPAMQEIYDTLLRKINEYYSEDGFDNFLNNSDESNDLIYTAIDDLLYASLYDEEDIEEIVSFFDLEKFDDSLGEDEFEEYLDELTMKIVAFFNSDKMKKQMFG